MWLGSQIKGYGKLWPFNRPHENPEKAHNTWFWRLARPDRAGRVLSLADKIWGWAVLALHLSLRHNPLVNAWFRVVGDHPPSHGGPGCAICLVARCREAQSKSDPDETRSSRRRRNAWAQVRNPARFRKLSQWRIS